MPLFCINQIDLERKCCFFPFSWMWTFFPSNVALKTNNSLILLTLVVLQLKWLNFHQNRFEMSKHREFHLPKSNIIKMRSFSYRRKRKTTISQKKKTHRITLILRWLIRISVKRKNQLITQMFQYMQNFDDHYVGRNVCKE